MDRIILDKSALQGLKADTLAGFFKNRIALIPDMLLYEIATETKPPRGNQNMYWYKLGTLPRCHIQRCPQDPQRLAEAEFRTGKRTADIVDEVTTREFLAAISCPGVSLKPMPPERVASIEKRQREWVEEVIAKMREKGFATILRELRRIVKDSSCTFFQAYLRLRSDDEGLTVVENMKRVVRARGIRCGAPVSFSPDRGWVSLELELLKNAQIFRCHGDSGVDGASDATVANYLNDLDYAVLLCKADGLISGDKKGLLPLAAAFFPKASLWYKKGEGAVCRYQNSPRS